MESDSALIFRHNKPHKDLKLLCSTLIYNLSHLQQKWGF